jgi:thiosulfate dehydrogenase
LHATLDREAPKGPNSLALSDDNLIWGIKFYQQHCAICHGTAKGDAASAVAKGEYPIPSQLAEGVEYDPEGVTFWKLEHGIRWSGMPS